MTPDRLREVLSYHPWTGEFRWKVSIGARAQEGGVAGYLTDQGFIKIRVDGRAFYAHRLAWLFMRGRWPSRLINHKNRKRTDNRWPNLREATSSDIQAHARPRRRGMSRGVDITPDGFKARIGVANQKFDLGRYRTEAGAYQAYLAAARGAFGEFAVE